MEHPTDGPGRSGRRFVRPGRVPKARRKWLGLVSAGVVVALVGAGYATVNAAPANNAPRHDAKHAKGVGAVVQAAEAFLATLSDDQKAEVSLEFSAENATAWSNLPCGSSCRPGIGFGTLSEEQLAAATKVLKAATGTSTGVGYDQVMKILLADDVLAGAQGDGGGTPPGDPSTTTEPTTTGTETTTETPTDTPTGTPPSGDPGGGGTFGYGSGLYYLAFLGTPSVDGTWQLHFGGHHLAVDITYEKGKVAGASPFFIGVEPTSWTADDGTTYEPLAIMADRMRALTGSLTADQLTKATLAESFSDVLVGPGEDGQFPTTKEGIAVRTLSPQQKQLVMKAMYPWVAVVDDATAKKLMATYQRELDQTYIGYSGGLGLDTQGDYVRIDGPGVWIEFVVQNGVVYRDQVHYHTVYRDHTRDYGGEFSF